MRAINLRVIGFVACLALLSVAPSVSSAQTSVAAGWDALASPELQKIRGGFEIGGVSFDFGAVVSTYVGGELALQTTLQWTPTGASLASQGSASTSATSASAASILSSLGINPAATTSGVVLTSGDGVTAVVQQLNASRITNLIVNTASNQNIRQDTNLSLTLPGFAATQKAYAQQLAASSLASSINAALRLSTPR